MLNINPFNYGCVVTGKDFCARPLILKDLISHIESGQNIVIEGERRTGKTSAIFQAINQIKDMKPIYIDLYFINTLEDFVKRFLNALVTFESKGKFLKKILSTLTHLRPTMSLDPLSGLPSFSVEQAGSLTPQTLSGLLNMVEELKTHNKICVVFDEFQSIQNLSESQKILASLRSYIQFQKDIPYIYAGSLRHEMSHIFHNPTSPFYKSAIPIHVGSIEEVPFTKFLETKFKQGRRKIDETLLNKIQEMVNKSPGDTQQFCAALWDVSKSGQELNENLFKDALMLIHRREQKGYEQILFPLTTIQKQCLICLVQHPNLQPFSGAFLKFSGIGIPATVKRAITRLEQLQILYKFEKRYLFSNPFMKYWVLYRGF